MADLATIRVYLTRGDAEVARAHLAAEGIDALVVADNEGGLNPGFYTYYGVRIVVRPEDVDAAKAVLGPDRLEVGIHPEMADAMIQHGRFIAPEEACGLLATDSGGDVRMVYCCTNVDRSPLRFTVSPHEHYHAWKHAERNGWAIGGVFHSHTDSAAAPSPVDIAGALDPAWVHVVVGPMSDAIPDVRAYRIVEDIAEEMTIVAG